MEINNAVILAGGRGDRLRPLTDKIPKPLAPINGVAFLDYLIYSIYQVGITNILLLLGYKADVIVARYNNIQNITIECAHGTEEDKTGSRILNAYDQLNDHFLLLYGDNYWPIELDDMRFNYQQPNAAVTTTVFSNKKGTGEYGFRNNVVVGNDGFVVKYDKKQETDAANGVDMGYFLIAKEALDPEMSGNVSFEEDILPKLIVKKQLGAYVTDTQYHYITNMDTLKSFETAVKENSFVPLPRNYFIKS